jgi:hypothetical protein
MTASFGNLSDPPVGPATATMTDERILPAKPVAKRDYHKPVLKRLGRLRSVTGSDFIFE